MKQVCLIIMLSFQYLLTYGQNIGINNPNPQVSLDVNGAVAHRSVIIDPFMNNVNIPVDVSFVIISNVDVTGPVTILAPEYIDGKRLIIYNNSGFTATFNYMETIQSGETKEFIGMNPGGYKLLTQPSQLEKITEGSNTGWRLLGQDAANYGDIGLGAIDLSISETPSLTFGATGINSVAMGANTTASGNYGATALGINTTASGANSLAMGVLTIASGDFGSTAMGNYTTASGYGGATAMGAFAIASGDFGSTAMGNYTTASGDFGATALGVSTIASGSYGATAMGYFTNAKSFASLALGRFNDTIAGSNQVSWVDTDPLVTIGNGKSNVARSNAMTIYKNGNIVFKNPTAVTTYPTSFTAPINGAGTRMMWLPEKSAFRVGTTFNTEWDSDSIGTWSYASGYATKAKGEVSTAMGAYTQSIGSGSTAIGYETTASGDFSTVIGYGSNATGESSIAMGIYTKASGTGATSLGLGTIALGNISTALGEGTIAKASQSLAIGRYNDTIAGSNLNTWIDTDPLLTVGNGTSNVTRSNAMTIYKNGTFNLQNHTSTPANSTDKFYVLNSEPYFGTQKLQSSQLEKITEGSNIGWRILGQNPVNYGDIGSGAVDLSINTTPSTTRGATGLYSIAMGVGTTASGNDGATALGFVTVASGYYGATALGDMTTASGNSGATALGYHTIASGNGGATALGDMTTASGNSGATALGSFTTANGGNGATAMGFGTNAIGSNGATAMGTGTFATGWYGATALGSNTTASGFYGATAMGSNTRARSYAQLATGRYNDTIAGSSQTTWVAIDPLLTVGNGTADNARSNAVTVYKNGNTDLNGYVRLGKITDDAPRIKVKKITGTSPAIDGSLTYPHLVDAAKIIGVEIFMQYGVSPSPTKVIPPSYTLTGNHHYQYEIDGANIRIQNVIGQSSQIGGKPLRIMITYEE